MIRQESHLVDAGLLRPASGALLSWFETAELCEIPLRVDERRLAFQRLLKLIGSVVDLALRRERDAQVVVGVGRVRHQLKGRSELIDRLLYHSCLQEGAAQIVACRAVTRVKVYRTPQMLDGFLLHPL